MFLRTPVRAHSIHYILIVRAPLASAPVDWIATKIQGDRGRNPIIVRLDFEFDRTLVSLPLAIQIWLDFDRNLIII